MNLLHLTRRAKKFLSPVSTRDESTEMILLTLVRAEETGRSLTYSDLTAELDSISMPQLQLLISQSLITVDESTLIKLTVAGRKRARTMLRRHRLVERHLTDVLGLDWVHAHEEADKLEHRVSDSAVQNLAEQLGNPELCPHGNPIPDAEDDTAPSSAIQSLAGYAEHKHATITRIAMETPAALQHLATLGLLPNVTIEVENRAPFGGPVMVRLGHAHYALGHDLAARIWVKEASSETQNLLREPAQELDR
jgi:DtxR family transcriptional regulator, Mn-dependent transcriptional regulator